MRISNKILVGAFSMVALTSCVSEQLDIELEAGTGIAELNVDLKKPMTRSTYEVSNFPVIIYDAEGSVVKSYPTVADVPSQITMSVGNYVVESHTPGDIAKKMDAPYYGAKQDMEILNGVTSKVDLVCKMMNSIVKVTYSADFSTVFKDWEITVDDGSSTVLAFTPAGETSVHWYFGEGGVKELSLNFRATTIEGNSVAARRVLTKAQADAGYDDGKENFGGGDILVLNFTPTENTDGKITSVAINADVTFSETNETINVNVTDKGGLDSGSGDSGSGDDTPGSDTGSGIVMNLPSNMTVSAATDPSLGDTFIKCDNGIKSISVKIKSTSDEMISSLADLNEGYGVDFLNGAEVVANQAVVDLFVDLGQTLTVPNVGDKEYTFPIGNFFGLLVFLSGDHTFDLVITDMNGNTKSGSLTLTVE